MYCIWKHYLGWISVICLYNNGRFWCLVQGGMGSALLSDPEKIEAVGIQMVILQIQCNTQLVALEILLE